MSNTITPTVFCRALNVPQSDSHACGQISCRPRLAWIWRKVSPANTISPGIVDTPMHAHHDQEALKKLSPIPRLVQISEIVDALFYLQSAPMVNGENIRIDGGSHAGAKW